ncbi:hypothetical protein DPMN_190864 [Dreissena polymorpha]|uniref:Uncharacterized protein n=1 Tax=Dreissena polymorpha TaxID=45954 RepID=A0A9D3XW54_DREPO|nr:hypothetical protein DPMN_190864 [Dreissena polymorpha]
MCAKFAALNILDIYIDTICNNVKNNLLSSAEEVHWIESREYKPWVKTEIMDLCETIPELRSTRVWTLGKSTRERTLR